MNGVEVLNVVKDVHYNDLYLIAVFSGFLAFIFLVYFVVCILSNYSCSIMSLILCVIFIIVCSISCYLCDKTSTPYIQYQVTISDNVNFNEFNNKYKIISQDGKIYTVEERVESK